MKDRLSAKDTAVLLANDRYEDAEVVLLCGSVIRGEGTNFSDLDIVIIYENLDRAYRDSFYYRGWPVEVFVHDPYTLQYFFEQVDKPSRCPSLPAMVSEGVVIKGEIHKVDKVKEYANQIIKNGPDQLERSSIDSRRYAITDLIDDLRGTRDKSEVMATGARLYEMIADFYFATKGEWSAKGKTIPKQFAKSGPEVYQSFQQAFDALFQDGDADSVVGFAERLLKPHGGFLFEGYKLDAPREWRLKGPIGVK